LILYVPDSVATEIEVSDYITMNQPMDEYCLLVLRQVGGEPSALDQICDILMLVGQIREYRDGILEKGGFDILLNSYNTNENDEEFDRVGEAILALLPGLN
jgi:hypothetical protein